MASPPTANQIVTQLNALLTPVIATSLMKKAKIIEEFPLAFLVAESEDATALESPLDTTTTAGGASVKRINCLMIVEAGLGQEPPQSDATQGITTPRGRNLITRRIAMVYLYQFGEGSQTKFSENVEVIRTTLNSNPKLGFPAVGADGKAGQGAFIHNHGGLQMPVMLPGQFAGRIAHVAEGYLDVRVLEALEVR